MSIVDLPAAETLLSAASSVSCVWFRVFNVHCELSVGSTSDFRLLMLVFI